MAAALQTLRHAHDAQARQLARRVMAPLIVASAARCHTEVSEAGRAGYGDWQAFVSLGDSLEA